jgi:predicted transglutaminase-like cysteine proteinase
MVPPAMADDGIKSDNIHQAAYSTGRDAGSAGLFNTTETKHTDLRPFTKWSNMLARFGQELTDYDKHAEMMTAWKKKLDNLSDLRMADKIRAVNDYINQIEFIPDQKNWEKRDYWATPFEFMANGGDCEDFAISKFVSLRLLGVSADDMRIAVVYDHEMKMPHAVLAVYHGDQTYILDNQEKSVKPSAKITRYDPIYSINQSAWWRHSG